MTEQELKEIICNRFLQGDLDFPIDSTTCLLDEGICDSLGLVQLVVEIEKRCPGVHIEDQEITRTGFGTMAAILELIERKQKN
ncbi:MAG TPA: acyl carrier protein [Burkholderiales bacterium]|nr:acyl carrier protein [Burkholderiales bacterium]